MSEPKRNIARALGRGAGKLLGGTTKIVLNAALGFGQELKEELQKEGKDMINDYKRRTNENK